MFIISNIFAGNINGERYRAEILTPFLNELHDDELIYGYLKQDGATAGGTRTAHRLGTGSQVIRRVA
jgi:hypothetical protein